MPLFWFLAGALTMAAAVLVLLPWLRTLAPLPIAASVGAVVLVVAVLAASRWVGTKDAGTAVPATAAAESAAKSLDSAPGTASSSSAFGTAAKVFGSATGTALPGTTEAAAGKPAAGSMDSAIDSLEARLAKGGGTPDDWELLAKSFDFLKRPADAAKARAHQLPSLPAAKSAADAGAPTPGASTPSAGQVTGEVALAPSLASKAAAGETLFIVAKSVDSPGIPVAVFRGSVGSWPLKFSLDDSQAMMPGRNLSTAGRVTIEARISQKGQPLPTAGDLQGSTGPINPADHTPLKIVIDRVIS